MANLILNGITKSFGENTIFRDFSYIFEENKIYVILGPSGIGKTTLLRIIAGLDSDFFGEVGGGGCENVSYVFQEYRLFPNLSALDNAAVSLTNGPDSCDRAKEMLLNLGFTESEMQLLPSELSGGMKQRVSIARALLKDAPILLLDEATKELDGELASKVLDLIKLESLRKTVIMVTHKPEESTVLRATEIVLTKG